MPKLKPVCPTCGGTAVKNLGGGTHNFYRYKCEVETCEERWQQIPLNRVDLIDFTSSNPYRITIGSRARDAYKCHKCGSVKKGHVCSEQKVDTSFKSVYVQPSSSLFQAEELPLPFSGFSFPPPPPNHS